MFSHPDAGKERNCSLCEKRKATVTIDSTVHNRCAGCADIEIKAYKTMEATIKRKIAERKLSEDK